MVAKLTKWKSSFRLVGNLSVCGKNGNVYDSIFKIDEKSKGNPNYIYSRMNVGIDCGDKYGRVYAQLMGGYNVNNPYGFRVHDKNDYKTVKQVSWEDRFNDDILNNASPSDTISIALERNDKNELIYKHFLSEYDAINYIYEKLINSNGSAVYENGLPVEVTGNLEYNLYNGKTTVVQNIRTIRLTDIRPENYNAMFIQTVLVDKNSIQKDTIDKDKKEVLLKTTVLQYAYKLNGTLYKCQFPYEYLFYLDLSELWDKPDKLKAFLTTLGKGRDGRFNQVTFRGAYKQYGGAEQVDESLIPDEIKNLIELGMANKEDIVKNYTTNDTKMVHEMVLESITDFIPDIYSAEDITPTPAEDSNDMKSTTVSNNTEAKPVENKQEAKPELDDAVFEALFGDDTLSI